MVISGNDMLTRFRSVLPRPWFPDEAPILEALLTGLAASWAALVDMLAFVVLQTRLGTATGSFLDLAAHDLFGAALVRRLIEGDADFRIRVLREIGRSRGTRPALVAAVTDATGQPPVIFEFARPADTGCWNLALGYGVAGGWGTLGLPFQALVTAHADPAVVGDDEIRATIAATLPVATIAWTRIAA